MSLWLLTAGSAVACGGFFCSPAIAPIDQAAEEIVFAVDTAAQTVEMHVEITYSGRSEDFAWVLPVPEEPELFLSSNAMFVELGYVTAPVFTTQYREEGTCTEPISVGCHNEVALASIEDYTPRSGTVWVGDQEQIGPFETTTLRASTTDALLGWLTANDYDLPPDLDPLLAPYVAEGSWFVAMRLAADADVGEIEPIGLRWPGTELAIPIQLTAVAAAEDMPLVVYVFGDARAVPDSYLEVEVNDAAIDWLGQGSNYPEVLRRAIDEAGGHAFVTEFSGSTDRVGNASDPLLEELLTGHRTLTRLITTLSPAEMTVDPTFSLHPGLPAVDNVHTADVVAECRGGRRRENANVRVELPDGRIVRHGPDVFAGATERSVRDLQGVAALSVSDLSSGEPVPVADFSADADEAIERHNAAFDSGCGCATAPIPGSLVAIAGLGLLARRRRRG